MMKCTKYSDFFARASVVFGNINYQSGVNNYFSKLKISEVKSADKDFEVDLLPVPMIQGLICPQETHLKLFVLFFA